MALRDNPKNVYKGPEGDFGGGYAPPDSSFDRPSDVKSEYSLGGTTPWGFSLADSDQGYCSVDQVPDARYDFASYRHKAELPGVDPKDHDDFVEAPELDTFAFEGRRSGGLFTRPSTLKERY